MAVLTFSGGRVNFHGNLRITTITEEKYLVVAESTFFSLLPSKIKS